MCEEDVSAVKKFLVQFRLSWVPYTPVLHPRQTSSLKVCRVHQPIWINYKVPTHWWSWEIESIFKYVEVVQNSEFLKKPSAEFMYYMHSVVKLFYCGNKCTFVLLFIYLLFCNTSERESASFIRIWKDERQLQEFVKIKHAYVSIGRAIFNWLCF